MAGTLSVVGSSVVDSNSCPCLCIDALPTSNLNVKTGRVSSAARKHLVKAGSLELSTCRGWLLSVPAGGRSSLKQRRNRRQNRSLVVVSELGGQYDDNFEDVKTQILNYFTYKAARTVLTQLYEMNPTQYTWFYEFVATNKPADGKRFIRTLGKEKQELAERVMITRLHLYGKWVKKCNHAEIYKEISDENLELMRERLMETVIWPSDDATNSEKVD